ncbi:hypothetical protein GEMRC1_006915 [Eukaryota sp. GEM-RC1]
MVDQNRTLASDIRFHTQHSSELEERAKKAEEKLAKIMMDKWSEETMVGVQVKKNQEDEKKILNLNSKILELERQLSELINKAEDSRAKDVDKMQILLEELTLENEALKRLVKLKSAKLNKIKCLADYIVKQRTTVEHFLLTSLEYVKTQANVESLRTTLYSSSAPRHRGPDLRSMLNNTDSISFDSLADVSDLDFSSMSWTVKEQVIKFLLQSISDSTNESKFASSSSIKNVASNSF